MTPELRSALYAQTTQEGLLALVVFEHPSWEAPVRLAGWPQSVTSRGQVYSPYPFELVLPEVSRDRVEPARISLSNVSRDLIPALRGTEGPITATLEFVRIGNPEIVEVSFPKLQVLSESGDVAVIEAPLTILDISTQRYPADQFSPSTFPGITA